MEEPRPDKVAVIDEVRERLESSSASVVTEYRGLTVAEMAELRKTLRAAGGDFKVFKNTLVRRALQGTSHEGISDFLEGPTGIAFVHGDVSAVAKALKDFSEANPALIIKGGVFEGSALSADSLKTLANLPSREVLLSQLAGLIASPMQSLAGLFKAVPQSFAYGLKALIESKPAEPAATEPAATEPAATEAAADEAPVAEAAPASDAEEVAADAPAAEEAAPEAEAKASVEDAPAEEAAPEEATPEEATPEEATPEEATPTEAPAEAASDESPADEA
jgi:large subunit ribosomal protein L10